MIDDSSSLADRIHVRPAYRFLLLVAVSLMLHMILGWEWTILAGVGAGLWFGRSAWLIGSAAVGLEWLLLVAFNYAVDARAVAAMTHAMGGILGNMPGLAIVGITLLIGLSIGALGGAAGSQVRRLLKRKRLAAHFA